MNLLAETETAVELPIPALWFGIIAVVVFVALLAVTYTFRNFAHRQAPETVGSRPGAAGHGTGSH